MVKTIARVRLLGLGLTLYPSNKQRLLSKDLTRYIKSLCRVRQNRVSKTKELLAGCQTPNAWAGLFKAGLRLSRLSAKFELRYERLKSKFSLILFVNKLMIGCS